VLRDERAVLPIGAYNAGHGVTLSLPSVVGREGVSRILQPTMSDENGAPWAKAPRCFAKLYRGSRHDRYRRCTAPGAPAIRHQHVVPHPVPGDLDRLAWLVLYFRLRANYSGEARWAETYTFWVKIFALTFALGVVSGVTMSFQSAPTGRGI